MYWDYQARVVARARPGRAAGPVRLRLQRHPRRGDQLARGRRPGPRHQHRVSPAARHLEPPAGRAGPRGCRPPTATTPSASGPGRWRRADRPTSSGCAKISSRPLGSVAARWRWASTPSCASTASTSTCRCRPSAGPTAAPCAPSPTSTAPSPTWGRPATSRGCGTWCPGLRIVPGRALRLVPLQRHRQDLVRSAGGGALDRLGAHHLEGRAPACSTSRPRRCSSTASSATRGLPLVWAEQYHLGLEQGITEALSLDATLYYLRRHRRRGRLEPRRRRTAASSATPPTAGPGATGWRCCSSTGPPATSTAGSPTPCRAPRTAGSGAARGRRPPPATGPPSSTRPTT